MTAAELRTRFDIELDAVASAAAPGFTNDEVSQLLTKAQDMLIQSYVGSKDFNAIYTLVETVETQNISAYTEYGGKCSYISLNAEFADFNYYVSSRLRTTRTYPTIIAGIVPCELIERNDIGKFISSGFNTPYFKTPKVLFEYYKNSSIPIIIILVDSYSNVPTDQFEMTYVRTPADIDIDGSVTSELPDNLHKDVVSLAVQEAVKSLYISKTPQTPRQ